MQKIYNSLYMTFPEEVNLQTGSRSMVDLGMGNGVWLQMNTGELTRMMKVLGN